MVRWPTGADRHLTVALQLAVQPDSALAVFPAIGRQIRAYGACVAGRGVVLLQLESGDIELYSGSSGLGARSIATFLGGQPGGRLRSLVEDVDRIHAHFESWQRPPKSVAEQMSRLSRMKRTAGGYIEVRTGMHEHPGSPAYYLGWFDIADDGRYLHYRRYNDLHIESADKQRLITAIGHLIDGGAAYGPNVTQSGAH